MALQTSTTIKIGHTVITNFSNLKIVQKIHDHHTFSLEVRQDFLVEEFKSIMPVSQQLYGERISIEIKPIDGLNDSLVLADLKNYVMQFYGIVAGVSMKKSCIDDIEESFLIEGYSTSFLLENTPESNSFAGMRLSDIVSRVKTGYNIDMQIRPFYDAIIPYTVQYNESCFAFLNRLAMRYGQYFYDNGRVLIFGDSAGVIQPHLIYGVNMQEFRYSIKLMPTSFTVIENDNREGSYSTNDTLDHRKELGGFHQNFINKSNAVYSKKTVMQLNQNAVDGYGSSTGTVYAQNKMRAVLSSLMEVTASSEVPGVTVGNTVKISGVDIQQESTYRVTEIVHTCDDGGGYENHFKAVNTSDSVFSPKTNPDLVPYCNSQTAVVVANADPDGLSAVKVQMPWQKIKGETTPYIPLVQEYGGNGRGSHMLPEIGDTVFVDFQGNNAELPIVVGTMTSRKEKSGYVTENNDIKAIRTKSGIENISNDAEGSWKQSTPDGNFLSFDGKGNAVLNIPQDLLINVGQHLNIKVGNNMTFDVGDIAKFNIFKEMLVKTPHLQQLISDYYFTQAGKTFINAENEIKIEAKQTHVAGSQKLLMHSDENTVVNSKGVVDLHGKKGNNHTNKPVKYKYVPVYIDERCLVHFRPKNDWDGNGYGFDWIRTGDTAIPGDVYYGQIMGKYGSIYASQPGAVMAKDKNEFIKLMSLFDPHVFTSKDKNGKKTKLNYCVPWLSLYPQTILKNVKQSDGKIKRTEVKTSYSNTAATLRVIINIQKKPEKLYLEYDDKLFKITHKPFPLEIGNHELEMTIVCLKEFSNDQPIKVITAYKNAEEKEELSLAGKLKVAKNKDRYKANVVFIQVWTDIGNGLIKGEPTGRATELKKYMKQALVTPYFAKTLTLKFNTDIDPVTKQRHNRKTNFNAIVTPVNGPYSGANKWIYDGTDDKIYKFLNEELYKQYGNVYEKFYKVYFIDENNGHLDSKGDLVGSVFGIGRTMNDPDLKTILVYTLGFNDSTIAHEVFHSMGLHHSFDNDGEFTFEYKKTDNIMDYSDNIGIPVISTYHWQWKILQKRAVEKE
ncbi:phage baseplate assembly protein V [Flavobacterium sp. IB48]|uniref:phage baseplate assembly protein V n=1 Tax=Flavobacterium sp. IB48 TaxID=2779375 RepID=UPI0018E6F200|nr:phage baseplate assembly protein V [Flavobacterium sp. IB48]MBJ2123196.1 hypothetical protein [Flavobacterium sp. IB48]